MKKQSSTWVFPTVKVLVSFLYYFLLVILVFFTGMCALKLVNAQVSLGDEPANYVMLAVDWESTDKRPRTSSGEVPFVLKPKKQTGELQVPIRTAPGLLTVGLGLIGLGTAVWTFLLLRKIFRTVRVESPFDPSIARYIRTMGLLFLGQSALELILKWVLDILSKPYLQQFKADQGIYPSVNIELEGPWLLGLILLALAQVYRRGIELQAENELTV